MPITVDEQVKRLREVTGSGQVADVCHRLRIEIVTHFGSSARPTGGITARDVDVAIGFEHGAARDFLAAVNALMDLVPGDHLDVMDLDRAGPVAAKAALFDSDILFEAAQSVTTERQIRAFMAYEDTRRLRELQLEMLRR